MFGAAFDSPRFSRSSTFSHRIKKTVSVSVVCPLFVRSPRGEWQARHAAVRGAQLENSMRTQSLSFSFRSIPPFQRRCPSLSVCAACACHPRAATRTSLRRRAAANETGQTDTRDRPPPTRCLRLPLFLCSFWSLVFPRLCVPLLTPARAARGRAVPFALLFALPLLTPRRRRRTRRRLLAQSGTRTDNEQQHTRETEREGVRERQQHRAPDSRTAFPLSLSAARLAPSAAAAAARCVSKRPLRCCQC
jgi:hypothetical protein